MKLNEMFRKARGALFMPYVCCGDPNEKFTVKLVKALVKNGADAIELGIPFSDPIADGKAIQAASQRALAAGMTPKKAIATIATLRGQGVEVPIVVMTYYNIVFAAGVGKFLSMLKNAGAGGLIVPDVPLGESAELRKACKKAGVPLIGMVTPNCDGARMKKIAGKAGGFLYAVAVFGTTGARKDVDIRAIGLVKKAKKYGVPVCAGFGISTPKHAAAFAMAGADGIIVGSGIVNAYSKFVQGKKIDGRRAIEELSPYCRGMKQACKLG